MAQLSIRSYLENNNITIVIEESERFKPILSPPEESGCQSLLHTFKLYA